MTISLQQVIALLILAFFVFRLFGERKKGLISGNEFRLWLSFWIFSALAIIFLKYLDRFTAQLGFSSSSISLLFYASVLFLFYLIFRLRLRLARMDKEMTEMARIVTLRDGEEKNKQ